MYEYTPVIEKHEYIVNTSNNNTTKYIVKIIDLATAI